MTLGEYVKKHGKGAKKALAKATGLRWQTVHEIAEGRTIPRIPTAMKIQEATSGEVTIFDMLGLDPATGAPLAATGTGE